MIPFEYNQPAFGDALELAQQLPDESINCIVTSPPYWGLRDYGHDGHLGLEKTPEEYTDKMVALFRELRRALCDDGTLWLNLGDSYTGAANSGAHGMQDELHYAEGLPTKGGSGLKPKDLVGIPWRVAFALQADGWYLRSDIIWAKPNPMPESVTDRPTKAHEYLFLMSKSERYFYDHEAVQESFADKRMGNPQGGGQYARDCPWVGSGRQNGLQKGVWNEDGKQTGRNRRSVWTVSTKPYPGAHFAAFPPDLIKPCILAGCPDSGIVLDPFLGSGTTGMVCQDLGRRWIGFELNEDYAPLIEKRTKQMGLLWLDSIPERTTK